MVLMQTESLSHENCFCEIFENADAGKLCTSDICHYKVRTYYCQPQWECSLGCATSYLPVRPISKVYHLPIASEHAVNVRILVSH